jgi:hypothetical protein
MMSVPMARRGVLVALFGCASTLMAQPPVSGTSSPAASAPKDANPAAASPMPAAQNDSFLLVGYVVGVHSCPRCSAAARCEPCEESLIVSNQRNPSDRTMTGDGNLRVIVPAASRFKIGAKVKLRVIATANQPFQNDPCCARLGPYVVRLVAKLAL